MKKLLIFYFLIFGIHYSFLHADLKLLFDKSVLKNRIKVQEILEKERFKKVYFYTNDHLKICGLFLDQSKLIHKKIHGTIILDAGFYPGAKEGIATFYALLADQPYNFLFFDARGHHESEGSFLNYHAFKHYGSLEYQDVMAAISFVQNYNQEHNLSSHIILHGICAGAFHNIKAAYHSPYQQYIKGIIFDSGWTDLKDIAESVITNEIQKFFKNSYFSFLEKIFNQVAIYCYRLGFYKNHSILEPLDKYITDLPMPILFIHATQDSYAPIKSTQNLAQKTPNNITWWVDDNHHASSHFSHKTIYQNLFKDFCQKCFN